MNSGRAKKFLRTDAILLLVALALPFLDRALPASLRLADLMRPIFIFAVLGLGLNVVTGFTGLLNLGVAAFMAIGTYTYAILTCDLYPFRLGFWTALVFTTAAGAGAGILLGAPTLRLRGDYIAIVTLGFCEIVQDVLKNLETITKGTQGINPLPYPSFAGFAATTENTIPSYYIYLGVLALAVLFCRNLENSRVGRRLIAIREDELAAACMGINPARAKLLAFAVGAALASLSGGLWASMLGTSGEPGNYDFAISITALCIVIIGGMGNISGVLLGALVMIGLNSIILEKLSAYMVSSGLYENETFGRLTQSLGFQNAQNVFTTPTSWKFMLFGLALILVMRFRPQGLLPARSGGVKS